MRCVFVLLLQAWLVVGAAERSCGAVRVHMLSGSEEYRSGESLAIWAAHLESEYGIASTISAGTDRSSRVDGLENLGQADALVVFCRRWELLGPQAGLVIDYIKSGRPVLGIRTASHAFQFYPAFDREILGGDYRGHWNGGTNVKIRIADQHTDRALLSGVADWERVGKPYKNPSIAAECQLLLRTTIGNTDVPLAWIRESKGGQRVFYTSLGVPSDFQNGSFVRLLDNALFWVMATHTAGRESPQGER